MWACETYESILIHKNYQRNHGGIRRQSSVGCVDPNSTSPSWPWHPCVLAMRSGECHCILTGCSKKCIPPPCQTSYSSESLFSIKWKHLIRQNIWGLFLKTTKAMRSKQIKSVARQNKLMTSYNCMWCYILEKILEQNNKDIHAKIRKVYINLECNQWDYNSVDTEAFITVL